MNSHILTLYDNAGNAIPIPAIQGVGIKDIRLREEGEDGDTYEIELDDKRVFTFFVKKGADYVLTEEDREEITRRVMDMLSFAEDNEF